MRSTKVHIATFRSAIIIAIGLCACWFIPPVAAANPLVAFTSMSGTCLGGSNNTEFGGQGVSVDLGSQGVAHATTMLVLGTTGEAGSWSLFGSTGGTFGPSDVQWLPGPTINPGDDLSAFVYCYSPISFTVQAFDTPTTPTSFSGATTAQSYSDLNFIAPGTAQYVADVSVQQGAVTVWPSGVAKGSAVVSSANVSLGTLDSGVQDFLLGALDGPQAIWTVSIRALPVVLTGPRFGVRAAQSGATLTASYNVTGDGTLTASIQRPDGGSLRSLASNLAVRAGDHSLTWDGFDLNGNPVRDGTYTLAFTFKDAAGNVASGNGTVLMDSTAPAIKMLSMRHISSQHGLVIKVTDPGSGVAAASLSIGRRVVKRLRSGNRLIYRPRSGWQTGRYHFVVKARDRVGNVRRSAGAFTVN